MDDPPLIPPQDVSRRRLLTRGLGIGLGAAVVGVGAAADIRYVDTGSRRRLAFAASHQATMPSSTRLLWHPSTDEKVVALTFDDGPDPRYTPQVLDLLAREQIHATFFLVGSRAAAHPDLVRRTHSAGHEIANHTWAHDDLSDVGLAHARADLGKTNDVLTGLTGRAPQTVRPPYGRVSGTMVQAAAELGLDVALWEQRMQVREKDAAGNVAWVTEMLEPGLVLLTHDGGNLPNQVGIDALPQIVSVIKAGGYRFVTIAEAFALDQTVTRLERPGSTVSA